MIPFACETLQFCLLLFYFSSSVSTGVTTVHIVLDLLWMVTFPVTVPRPLLTDPALHSRILLIY